MPNRFDKFIHDENIKNFSKQIETETDPGKAGASQDRLE